MKLSMIRKALSLSALSFLGAAGCSAVGPDDSAATAEELSGERARSYAEVPYRGVNLSGAEFGAEHLPGQFGKDYTYPTCAEVEYFVHRGMNTFRVPMRWERLQHAVKGPLDAAEVARMKSFVEVATSRGAHVILEVHNFGAYGWASSDASSQPEDRVIGSARVPVDALADFWEKIAREVRGFRHPDRVVFGLMNEPERIKTRTWFDAAERSIVAIRATGSKNLVLVPGVRWTGAHSWAETPRDPGGFDPGESSADGAASMLKRLRASVPDHEPIAFEAHEYVDSDFSGTKDGDCSNASTEHFEAFRRWLVANGARGFVGEFGVPKACASVASDFISYFEKHATEFAGWTYWAGGPWWGSYFLSIEPGAPAHDAVEAQLGRHLEPFAGGVPNRCGGAPAAHPTPRAGTPEPPHARPGHVGAALRITSEWGGGYCADVKVDDRGRSVDRWSVTVDVGAAQVTETWSATAAREGELVTFTPVAFNHHIGAGGTADFGFCARRPAGAGAPVVVKVR